MLNYAIQVGICWSIFLLLYGLFLRGETFFRLNRWYLLGTLVLGLLIPVLDLPWQPVDEVEGEGLQYFLEPVTVTVQQLEYTVEAISVQPTAERPAFWFRILPLAYLLGAVFFLLRMGWGFGQLYRLYQRSVVEPRRGYVLVRTSETHSPFSFFRYLFWSRSLRLAAEEENYVLQHELAHLRQYHSLDIVLLELLGILFWFLPPIYYYKTALRNVHEYLADAAVYDTAPKKQYGQLLLKQAQSGQHPALAHSIFHSQLKQRIIMMTKNTSSRIALVKYLGLLPLAAFLLLAFSTTDFDNTTAEVNPPAVVTNPDPFEAAKVRSTLAKELASLSEATDFSIRKAAFGRFRAQYDTYVLQYPERAEEIKTLAEELIAERGVPIQIRSKGNGTTAYFMETAEGAVFTVVDQMPHLPGCEDLEGEAFKTCTQQLMLSEVYANIQYPEAARERGLEGVVVARFIVDKDGRVHDPEIMRSIGGGCDEEVLRVVKNLPQWVPGRQAGAPVAVQMHLPVKFKLAGGEEKVLEVADRMPLLPGCEDQACSNAKLFEFLMEHLEYPEDAKQSGIEGMVMTKFIIDSEGHLRKPRVTRSLGYGCDEAVLMVVEQMKTELGPWTPGATANGKSASVYFNLPVAFRLEGTERDAVENPVRALSLNNFSAFPNPADEYLNVRFDAEVSPTQIALRALDGRELLQQDLADFDGHYEDQLPLDRIPNGTLLLTIRQGEKVFVQKVLVQR